MRYFFEISYKGTNYHGWQIQKNALAVQQVFNESLSILLREPVETLGSSRTDTGVHASQQFFHLDTTKIIEPEILISKMNSLLPGDISVKSIRPVKPNASCRFDATSRSYEYHIIKRKDPFLSWTAVEIRKPLDVDAMNLAATYLIGKNSFKSFCRNSMAVPGHDCDVSRAIWKENGDSLIFLITANRFLRGMVRSIVGTLIMVGDGSITSREFAKILNSKDRKLAGPAAPAKGLCLTKVKYPPGIFKVKSS
jgi:tRNA pseudouridine38-40 synthase